MDGLGMDELLTDAPGRASANASGDRAWKDFEVDDEAGTIRRPPGLGFDPGGTSYSAPSTSYSAPAPAPAPAPVVTASS